MADDRFRRRVGLAMVLLLSVAGAGGVEVEPAAEESIDGENAAGGRGKESEEPSLAIALVSKGSS